MSRPEEGPRAANEESSGRQAMPDLRETLALPLDEEGPVFREPWEAQAFAMTINLYRAGHFTWTEWTAQLSQEIAAAKERGEPDTGETTTSTGSARSKSSFSRRSCCWTRKWPAASTTSRGACVTHTLNVIQNWFEELKRLVPTDN